MSLLKKREMTKRRLEALAKNRTKARGPATPAGRERIRAANLRHGFYSPSDEVALCALGEDPAHFRRLLEGLGDPRTVAATLQQGLAHRLARALWRMERADRMQDGHALRQAREEAGSRQGRLHMQMMRLKMVARHWQSLAQSVARPFYVTPHADLKLMKELHKEGAAKEMSEVALALFYQLREPGLPCPGDPGFQDDEQQEQQRQVLMRIKEIFGLNDPPPFAPSVAPARYGGPEPTGQPDSGAASLELDGMEAPSDSDRFSRPEGEVGAPGAPEEAPHPYPNITPAEWAAREPVRQLLENLLNRQVEIFDGYHRDLMRQTITGPSPYERAAELVPNHPKAALMERMEYAHCRQLLRLSSVLIRLRRQEAQMEKLQSTGVSTEVKEK